MGNERCCAPTHPPRDDFSLVNYIVGWRVLAGFSFWVPATELNPGKQVLGARGV